MSASIASVVSVEILTQPSTITDLLAIGVDTSPFEDLTPWLLESVRALHSYSTSMAQFIISTLLLNLMVATEVSDMAQVVNKAFQCPVVYNLDL